MANKKFIVSAPDGTDVTVIAPEDATDERLIELAKSQVQQKEIGKDVIRKGGLVARAIAPYAAGASLGAALGAPFAGIGAIPGALMGAGAVGLGKTVGDIGAMGASAVTGKDIPGPTAVIEPVLSKIGFPEPQTPAERMLYTGAETTAGALTPAGAAKALALKIAPGARRSLLEAIGAKPTAQAAVAASGATGTQGLLEAGVEPAIAIPAGVAATFAAGHKFASPAPEKVLSSQVKGAADEAFTVARESPLTVNGNELRRVIDNAVTEAQKEGFRPDLQPSVFRAINLIQEEAGESPEITLKSIDEWRRVLQQAGKSNPTANALFNNVRSDIDALVTKEIPDDPFKVARQQWATGSKLEAIENAAERARISGGSLQNELKSLLKNKKQMRFFTEEERAKIEAATEGGVPAKAVALIGEMFPRWASVISGGAGIYTGNIPEAAAALVLPEISRALASRATERRVEGLLGQIGGAPQTPARSGQAAIRGLPAAAVGSGLLEMGAYPEKR